MTPADAKNKLAMFKAQVGGYQSICLKPNHLQYFASIGQGQRNNCRYFSSLRAHFHIDFVVVFSLQAQ